VPADPETGELSAPSGSVSILPADYDGPVRASTSCRFCIRGFTANCAIIGHFTAFESGLVAPFLYLRDKTAGFESKRPEI
jgi:hypothetical protein